MQLIAALTCVALASCYLIWRWWRVSRGSKTGCGGSCSCPSTTSTPPKSDLKSLQQLTLRRR